MSIKWEGCDFLLTCDNCGLKFIGEETEFRTRYFAEADGWRCDVHGDWCRDCKDE